MNRLPSANDCARRVNLLMARGIRKSVPLRPLRLDRLVSGGQTGADRAALDWAIASRIPHGGWCPKGRLAEDGPISRRYRLWQTPLADHAQRTNWNVRDSDGTVIFTLAPRLTGGCLLTQQFARQYGKPCLHLAQRGQPVDWAPRLRRFLARHGIRILNAAGSRASREPAVGAFVARVLRAAFAGQ